MDLILEQCRAQDEESEKTIALMHKQLQDERCRAATSKEKRKQQKRILQKKLAEAQKENAQHNVSQQALADRIEELENEQHARDAREHQRERVGAATERSDKALLEKLASAQATIVRLTHDLEQSRARDADASAKRDALKARRRTVAKREKSRLENLTSVAYFKVCGLNLLRFLRLLFEYLHRCSLSSPLVPIRTSRKARRSGSLLLLKNTCKRWALRFHNRGGLARKRISRYYSVKR